MELSRFVIGLWNVLLNFDLDDIRVDDDSDSEKPPPPEYLVEYSEQPLEADYSDRVVEY